MSQLGSDPNWLKKKGTASILFLFFLTFERYLKQENYAVVIKWYRSDFVRCS